MLGLNLPMFLASLLRSFRSKPCDDLRLAVAGSFGFVVRYSSSEGAGEYFNTTPSIFCSRVSPETGDPVLFGRGEIGACPVLDGS